MQYYNKANLVSGWLAFLAAATVYILTVEPTTSFWDCGEFITAACKLQVGHPPGAPFFMLLGRFFTLFAGRPENVAISMNIMSALASAFTILFLFWTITHLAKKIVIGQDNYSTVNIITVLGAGFTGAMAYTFSDTFWFSAVEAEVYALSSLFTAVVFWAILKWENVAGQPYANRWLILIAYLMGLSIGVHLLNLLAIPAIVFVFYFRNYSPTVRGFFSAAAVSVLLLVAIMYGIIQGVVVAASYFELFFVNSIGLPYKSGVIIFLLLTVTLLTGGLVYTFRSRKPLLHNILLGITVILIGYSSFSLIMIRSLADPPMDQNSPDNVFSLLYYLNRGQYEERPLFHGRYYNAPVTGDTEGRPSYIQKDGKYVPARRSFRYLYDNRFETLFPRMYSSVPDHVEAYREWAKIGGREVRVNRSDGQVERIIKPTFTENLRFFFRYQLGHMYGRYFMWNFAGRQNDIQGHGRILEGNWLSGIHFLDRMRLGPQYGLPEHLENNRARNKYYMLPLLLGVIGLLFQLQKDKKDTWVVFLLFFFTGAAIVIYLNQTPYQPRERDYAYAGSFYAFSIWIGLGVIAVYDNLKTYVGGRKGALLASLIPLIFVPGVMAIQNFDDHDRSGRYTARDFAWNYLNSCAPGAILFTYGDNDTFPLWYAQEVEGIRTDVRVVNLSYLSADWYIDQMKRKVYDSDPLPLSIKHDQYVQGTRDIIYLLDRMEDPAGLKSALDFALSDDPGKKIQLSPTDFVDYIPSNRFFLEVDSLQVIRTGTVAPDRAHLIEPVLEWQIDRNYITKSGLAVLDLLATNNWERPVYFAITVPQSEYLGLSDYFQLEGMAYRLVPVLKSREEGYNGHVNTDIMYSNITEKFRWGNIYDPAVYLDETNIRMATNLRSNFARLSGSLIDEGRHDSAVVILDMAMDILPKETVPYNYFIIPVIENYYLTGEFDKASAIAGQKAELLKTELNYYISLESNLQEYVEFEIQRALTVYQELLRVVSGNDPDLEQEINTDLNSYYQFIMEY
ncbi:MAG: DUF2723 domain-containing protein [Bacteroidales bacterium]